MKLLSGLLALGMAAWSAQALEVLMDESNDNSEYCTGMYSRSSWGGPVDPFILVKFLNQKVPEGDDPMASLIIFEWNDRDYVGIPDPDGWGNQLALCQPDLVEQGYCNKTNIGEFVVSKNATEKAKSLIVTKAVHFNDLTPIEYPITRTGYYCVFTQPFTVNKYQAVTEFRNAYGELRAAEIPKLAFYGVITIVYTLMASYWGFLYYQHRSDILPVQNYITAILVFLVVEMLLTWGYYEYENRHGNNIGAVIYFVVIGILNAARESFSFFLLLIVCMGYGVVKPTLGRTMIYVRWLAAVHFVLGIVYAVTNLWVTPENAGPFLLFIVIPLLGTLSAFYVWTLNSLNLTLKELRERRQHAKELMYKKLWWAILLSILVIFAFLFFNSFAFATVSVSDFVPEHWKTRWFVLDGWLNVVYLLDVAWIAYIWRPNANNRVFAMSEEIAQDDDGNFEIGDIGVPGLSDDEDEEAQIGKGAPAQQAAGGAGVGVGASVSRTQQPGPSRNAPRDSMEGETLFAVGDDGDKFSDDDSDEENAKLVHKKD